MDAWLTRLLAPKPATHGTIAWWQGEDAAAGLCETLLQRQIRHALVFSQGSAAIKTLAEALAAAGLEVEWGHEPAARHRGENTVILTDMAGLPAASRLAGDMRRQARRDAQRLQSLRRSERQEAPAEAEAPTDAAGVVPEAELPGEPIAPEAVPEAAETVATPGEPIAPKAASAEAASEPKAGEAIAAETAAPETEAAAETPAEPVPAETAPVAESAEMPVEAAAPETEAAGDAAAEPALAETASRALIAQEAPPENIQGVPLLVLVPDTLALPALAAMDTPPEGVVLLPGFAGEPAAETLQDLRLSALATAVEQLICRKTSRQTRQDAQAALALMEKEPLTPELAAQMTLLAGKPEGYAACLGAAVHQAHRSIPLGAARLACLRELLRRYGVDARSGLELCALAVGRGGEKAAPEKNVEAFLRWLEELCAAWGVTARWRCLRNTELPDLTQGMLRQVRLAPPKRLSAQELAQALGALKQQETELPAMEALCRRQQEFFETGKTLPLDFRFQQLDALKRWITGHEEAIQEALFADLGKSAFEAYETEILTAREELHYLRTHLSALAATAWYRAPLMHWPSRCFTVQEPYGRALIMAPWNYPFLLSVEPLMGAIAAGNCVVLKPSAYAPATSRLLREMAESLFDPEYVAVVEGGREENQALLEQKFDCIFFTGSVAVGKVVMAAASRFLTPVTLELGGKSPCIVDETADIALAARRIAWGKFLNAGQTCVAPDYVLCHESVQEKLVKELRRQIRLMWGKEPLRSPELPRIVNRRHFERLCGYLTQGTVEAGGDTNPETLQIAPTVLSRLSWEAPVMQEEIFGPILPVVAYGDFDSMLAQLRRRPKPLAGYLFTRSQAHEDAFLRRFSCGGGCINDVISHLVTTCLPFGGVGESGMGSYHGRKTFEAFSHTKPMLKKSLRVDVSVRYPPYKKKIKWLRRLSK